MGSYTYCDCGAGLDKPTAYDDLTEGNACHSCGKTQPQIHRIEEYICELFEEIKELNARLDKL